MSVEEKHFPLAAELKNYLPIYKGVVKSDHVLTSETFCYIKLILC